MICFFVTNGLPGVERWIRLRPPLLPIFQNRFEFRCLPFAAGLRGQFKRLAENAAAQLQYKTALYFADKLVRLLAECMGVGL